jgi:hypothetical protein
MNNPLWLIITIDFENMNSWLKEGRYEQSLFTVDVIQPLLDLLDQHNVKAVFFASVFEHCLFGKNAIRKALKYLDAKGHDVQLHTHPYWCYGREHMWQYSLDEQIEIINNGCELFKEWFGRYPIAHRAGAYGINQDTLKALRHNDIFIDSSMFHKRQNCKVSWSRNQITEKDGTLEIPVTGFYKEKFLNLKLLKIKYRKKFIKTDIDWCSNEELLYFVDEAKKNNIKVVNFFMHSYSVLKYDEKFKRFDRNEIALQNLNRCLSTWAQDNQIRFITLQELLKLYKKDSHLISGSDYVPVVQENIDVFRILSEKFRKYRKNK